MVSQTVPQLAAAALRRIGVSAVSGPASPASAGTLTPAAIAQMALNRLGVSPLGLPPAAPADVASTATLAPRLLVRMGVYASDETPLASDVTLATNALLQVHAMLIAMAVVPWADGAIPDQAAELYITMASYLAGPAFGLTVDPTVYAQGTEIIRQMALSGTIGLALPAIETTTLHAEMDLLGIVGWTVNAIPRAAGDAYATIVASRLAPLYAKPRDEKAIEIAMGEVRNLTLQLSAQALAQQVLMELHAEWRVRNMTRWEVMDIPREAEESYIAGVGARLAPQFPNAQSPPGALLVAETGLYRIVALATSGLRVQAEYF